MKHFITLLLMLAAFTASAFDIDGNSYNVSSDGTKVALKRCNSKATDVIIPATVSDNGTTYPVIGINDGAFYQCTNLTSITIPSSVTVIGHNAFNQCSNLTSVIIPNSVTYIGIGAFSECSGLTSIQVEQGNPNYDSRNNCNAIIETGTNKIIAGCKSATIPNSVTRIDDAAFNGCTGLTKITIPNSVTEIGEWAFYRCTGLTSVSIPKSVTKIGEMAFLGCTGLSSVTIPKSATEIGYQTFSECSGLTSIQVEKGNPNYDSRDNCNAIIETENNTLITGCKNTTIPKSVNEIGYNAFSGCTGLTSISIPSSVTAIGSDAFSGCTGLTNIQVEQGNPNYDSRDNCNAIIETDFDRLVVGCKNTTIPNTVSGIGVSAFSGCTSLTSVSIPNSVTRIGETAFVGCTGLTSIDIPASVAEIGESAFSGCTSLTSVGIPSSVTEIGESAFWGCVGLTSITISESIAKIGFQAFSGCTGLTNIQVEQGNPNYDSRDNCNAIIETNFDRLVVGCKNTTIPNSVSEIGVSAFCECTGLTSIDIPNSVTRIGETAFVGCTGLTSIDIPASVTEIGESAFLGCTSLTSATIPASVTEIGKWAFSGCDNLSSIYCHIVNPEVLPDPDAYIIEKDIEHGYSFEGIPACVLYVPKGSAEKYRKHKQFEKFSEIVEIQTP